MKTVSSISTAGVWSCPATTGDRPPPCSAFTFTAVDDRRAVLFGGFNIEQGRMNDVFIIVLSTMVLLFVCACVCVYMCVRVCVGKYVYMCSYVLSKSVIVCLCVYACVAFHYIMCVNEHVWIRCLCMWSWCVMNNTGILQAIRLKQIMVK